MNRTDHLLTILAEECCEVAQRATKALRFGLNETQPGQDMTNENRILLEFCDLLAVMEILLDEGHFKRYTDGSYVSMIDAKKAKIEKFLLYSADLGTLQS